MKKSFFVAAALTLSGCAPLSQLHDPIWEFDQAVHSITTSQMAYYNGAHTVECERQFYANAFDTVLKAKNIDLREKCVVDDRFYLTSRQIEARRKLFEAITLYVDKLQAVASGEDAQNLDSSLQAQATGINGVASSAGLSKNDVSIASYVETAVAELTKMALEQKKIKGIKEAAKSQKDNLATVVEALKKENLMIAYGVNGDIGEIRSKLAGIASAIRDQQGPAVFTYLVSARGYLRSINLSSSAMTILPDDTITDSRQPSPDKPSPDGNQFSAVLQLNKALDGIVAANNALAEEPEKNKTNLVSAVNNLVALSKDAAAFQKAITQ